MLFACCLASENPYRFLPAILAIPLVIIRILAEEATLRADETYGTYTQQVRYHLLPGIW